MKYICVAKCPEIDENNLTRCTTCSLETTYERWLDGCPCGNIPEWKEKEVNNTTQEIYMSDGCRSLEERKVKALETIADCLEEYLSSGLPVRQ